MLGPDRSPAKEDNAASQWPKDMLQLVLTRVQGKRCFSVWHQPARSSWQGSHSQMTASHLVSLCSVSHLSSAPCRELWCPSPCLFVCVCMFKLRSNNKSVTEEESITPTSDYRVKQWHQPREWLFCLKSADPC